jgi:hypothetical protein
MENAVYCNSQQVEYRGFTIHTEWSAPIFQKSKDGIIRRDWKFVSFYLKSPNLKSKNLDAMKKKIDRIIKKAKGPEVFKTKKTNKKSFLQPVQFPLY